MAGNRQVTVILNSERPMTQGIALVLANQMLEQGAQLKILLCDAAGDLALRDAPGMEPLQANNLTPEQLLLGALKKGAVVEVCALYLPNAGKQATDLKEGVTPAKPPAIAAELLQEDREVLVF
jgi:hypothetical protein